jgi:hypothetical protein
MAICRLCGKDKPLIRAHIFPDWAYRHLKQDNHLIHLTSVLKSRKIQSGYWDSNILCRECDGDVIGKYDTYAAQFFDQDFSPMLTTFTEAPGREARVYQVKNFDYSKLFIFIVSLFWRASITDQPAFAKVTLGRYEDMAKEIILAGVPMYEDFFEVAIFVAEPPVAGQKFEKSILHPFPARFGEANCYLFVFAGFDFVLKVDQRKSNLHIPGITMRPEGFNIILTPFEGSTMGKEA